MSQPPADLTASVFTLEEVLVCCHVQHIRNSASILTAFLCRLIPTQNPSLEIGFNLLSDTRFVLYEPGTSIDTVQLTRPCMMLMKYCLSFIPSLSCLTVSSCPQVSTFFIDGLSSDTLEVLRRFKLMYVYRRDIFFNLVKERYKKKLEAPQTSVEEILSRRSGRSGVVKLSAKKPTPFKKQIISSRQNSTINLSQTAVENMDLFNDNLSILCSSALDPLPLFAPLFMPYCCTMELNLLVSGLLSKLNRFQLRKREKSKANANLRKRLVLGFNEVLKTVKNGRSKLLVLAIDLENSADGDNPVALRLQELLDLAQSKGLITCSHLLGLR
ncbi:hypothetical protein GEMRC1_001402 [Eukaryota sp. GEM-RC1]